MPNVSTNESYFLNLPFGRAMMLLFSHLLTYVALRFFSLHLLLALSRE